MTLPTLSERAVLCCFLIERGVARSWTPTLEGLPQVLGHPRLKGRPAPARTLAIGMTLPTLSERAVLCCILIGPGVATAWTPTLEGLPQVLGHPLDSYASNLSPGNEGQESFNMGVLFQDPHEGLLREGRTRSQIFPSTSVQFSRDYKKPFW
jgi:hypothetical protein